MYLTNKKYLMKNDSLTKFYLINFDKQSILIKYIPKFNYFIFLTFIKN